MRDIVEDRFIDYTPFFNLCKKGIIKYINWDFTDTNLIYSFLDDTLS